MGEKKFLTDITNVCFTDVVGDSAINSPPQCDPYLLVITRHLYNYFLLHCYCHDNLTSGVFPLDLIKQI